MYAAPNLGGPRRKHADLWAGWSAFFPPNERRPASSSGTDNMRGVCSGSAIFPKSSIWSAGLPQFGPDGKAGRCSSPRMPTGFSRKR
jgi:hypothetical protein